MNVSIYVDEDTPFHRLDPRTKILLLLVGMVLHLSFTAPYVFAILLLALGVIALCARAIIRIWQARRALLFLSVLTGVTWLLYGTGLPAGWKTGHFGMSVHSVLFSLAMMLRVFGVGLLVILMFAITRPDDFCAALALLRLPYRVAFVFSLAYRLVPAYVSLGQQIIEAQTCRGMDLYSGNPVKRLRKLAAVGIPLLVGAVRQAQLMHIALYTRGFNAEDCERIYYREYRLAQNDLIALIVGTGLLFAALLLRYFGWGVLT